MAALDAAASFSPLPLAQMTRACDVSDAFSFGCTLFASDILTGFIVVGMGVDEATVLALSVLPDRQGLGLGTRLLQHALGELAERRVERCLLEVRATNAPALALYARCGFSVDGTRANYYKTPTGREDAILMSRQIQRQAQQT